MKKILAVLFAVAALAGCASAPNYDASQSRSFENSSKPARWVPGDPPPYF